MVRGLKRSQEEVPMVKKAKPVELIISKTRTKNASKKCNVSSEFYGALDKKVKDMITDAEKRAIANKRKTLKPQDL
jgi:histone H3/H4